MWLWIDIEKKKLYLL